MQTPEVVEERLSRLEKNALLQLAEVPDWVQDALQTSQNDVEAAGEDAKAGCKHAAGDVSDAAADEDASLRKSSRKRKLRHESLTGMSRSPVHVVVHAQLFLCTRGVFLFVSICHRRPNIERIHGALTGRFSSSFSRNKELFTTYSCQLTSSTFTALCYCCEMLLSALFWPWLSVVHHSEEHFAQDSSLHAKRRCVYSACCPLTANASGSGMLLRVSIDLLFSSCRKSIADCSMYL